jgi:RimJ/RimL family protein N-acetyltransferase
MRYRKNPTLAGFAIPKDKVVTGIKVKLRRKRLEDARHDHTWQSDEELARLDAAPVLGVSFPLYLLDYTCQMHDSGLERYLAVDTLDGRHIGNCTYYDVDEKRGEAQVGIMIGERDYWDKGYGTDAMTMLVNHIFLNTRLQRVYLKTLDWNLRAQRCFQKCGFLPCRSLRKNGYNFIVMELTRKEWEKSRESKRGSYPIT